MNADIYNKTRRILFSTANDPMKGFSVAYEWMEKTYRTKLDPQSYVGLMAELKFYERHGREFYLTVAGDMGEHADFAGMYGSVPARFDVTTNINFKNFRDYEPFMGGGPSYKIALLDEKNFEIVDVLSLAFPNCTSCGGYLFPAIILLGQNHNRHGEPLLNNDQLLVDVCGGCEDIILRNRYTLHGMPSPQEYYDDVYDLDNHSDAMKYTMRHVDYSYKYFRRRCSDYLMAVGSHGYITTEPDGGGHWAINFDFKNSAVAMHMPNSIECSNEI